MPMNPTAKAAYLNRLHLNEPIILNEEYLTKLHINHLQYIPYENFDIINKLDFNLESDKLFQKIITTNRGGYCYELNLLFHAFLNAIGYKTKLLSAQLITPSGEVGDKYDHPLIVVELNGLWLLDVGNSKWFTSPILLPTKSGSTTNTSIFEVELVNETYKLNQYTADQETPIYQFSLDEIQPTDFTTMCHKKWTTPNSKYTKHYIISKFENEQRISLKNDLLTILSKSNQLTKPILNEAAFKTILIEHFGTTYSNLVLNYS